MPCCWGNCGQENKLNFPAVSVGLREQLASHKGPRRGEQREGAMCQGGNTRQGERVCKWTTYAQHRPEAFLKIGLAGELEHRIRAAGTVPGLEGSPPWCLLQLVLHRPSLSTDYNKPWMGLCWILIHSQALTLYLGCSRACDDTPGTTGMSHQRQVVVKRQM